MAQNQPKQVYVYAGKGTGKSNRVKRAVRPSDGALVRDHHGVPAKALIISFAGDWWRVCPLI